MPRDTLIQVRAGTTAQWAAANPILALGEHGLDTTLMVEKIGDGSTAWLSLPTPAGGMTAAALAADAAFTATYAPLGLLADTYTYNGDGSVATSTTGGILTTYTYNTDGTVATEVRLGKTKTYTYNVSGDITGSVVV